MKEKIIQILHDHADIVIDGLEIKSKICSIEYGSIADEIFNLINKENTATDFEHNDY